MASDNHANYSRIGFAVVVGIAAIVGTLIYLGGFGDGDNELPAETYYDTPVSGLTVGSPVNFRGVKVGEVRRISFVGSDYPESSEQDEQRIRIVISFDLRQIRLSDGRTPRDHLAGMVAKGLRATVTSSGITGLSRIELNYPKAEMNRSERLSWKPAYIVIPSAPSLLDSFSEAATKVMNQINRMDFTGIWSNVSSVAWSAAELTGNVNSLIESQKTSVNDIFENVNEAARAIRELSQSLRENPSLLLRPNDPQPLSETRR